MAHVVIASDGNADGDTIGGSNSIQVGLGLQGVQGKQNMPCLIDAWIEPTDDDLRVNTRVELFQRFQVTGVMRFMVGVLVILDLSCASDDDLLEVFSARIRVSF